MFPNCQVQVKRQTVKFMQMCDKKVLGLTCLFTMSKLSWAFFSKLVRTAGSVTSLFALNSYFVFSSAYSL